MKFTVRVNLKISVAYLLLDIFVKRPVYKIKLFSKALIENLPQHLQISAVPTPPAQLSCANFNRSNRQREKEAISVKSSSLSSLLLPLLISQVPAKREATI